MKHITRRLTLIIEIDEDCPKYPLRTFQETLGNILRRLPFVGNIIFKETEGIES